jgi:hypothetical protein
MAIVFLDSGIIGLITSPRKQGQALACEQWMLGLLARGVNIVSSEICDYEECNSQPWKIGDIISHHL